MYAQRFGVTFHQDSDYIVSTNMSACCRTCLPIIRKCNYLKSSYFINENAFSFILQTDSVVKTSWPKADKVNNNLLQCGEYLMEAAHSFRLQQKNILNMGAKKNQTKFKEIEKPAKAVAWVAKTFPPWQTTILETMKQLYTVCIYCIYLVYY